MDITTLIIAALVSLGFIGAEAALTVGTVGFKIDVAQELSREGYSPTLIDTMVDTSLKKQAAYRSVIRPPRIKLSEEKSIVATLEEALNLQAITLAFQTEFGFDPVRIYGSLMVAYADGKQCGYDPATGQARLSPATAAPPPATTANSAAGPDTVAVTMGEPERIAKARRRYRFLVAGSSRHTGSFVIDCTSKPDAELREFIDLVTLDIIEALEPYAAAIAQFKAFHEQKMSGGGNITRLRMVVERRVKREQAGGAGNDIDVAALYNLMAIAYLMDRNEAEATALLERAVATAPEFGVPNLNLALLNLMHQRPDAALALVRTASQSPMIAASPVLAANAETIEAIVLWQKGDLPSASAHFLKAVKTYPRSFFGYYYWSELARSIGNLDDAALLRKRAETNLAANETYPEIGLLYFLGHPGKAGDLDFRLVDTDKVRSLADLERQGGG